MKLSQEPCRHGRYRWHAYMLYITRLGCPGIKAMNEPVTMAWYMLHLSDGCAWGSSDTLHHLTIKERNTDSAGDLSNALSTYPSMARAALHRVSARDRKKLVQVNQFLHSYTRPSRAHLILKRCTLHAWLSSNCQSRCQEGWWTILSATDDRWRGVRGARWVHVKGSASKGLL